MSPAVELADQVVLFAARLERVADREEAKGDWAGPIRLRNTAKALRAGDLTLRDAESILAHMPDYYLRWP